MPLSMTLIVSASFDIWVSITPLQFPWKSLGPV